MALRQTEWKLPPGCAGGASESVASKIDSKDFDHAMRVAARSLWAPMG